MSEEQWPEVFICPICGKSGGNVTTIRQSWLDAGGGVVIPPASIVHVKCDDIEQRRLKQGKLQLSDLWVKEQTL